MSEGCNGLDATVRSSGHRYRRFGWNADAWLAAKIKTYATAECIREGAFSQFPRPAAGVMA